MKLRNKNIFESTQDEEFQMSSLIDVVFLLLIYFIVSTTLLKSEADLGITLPGSVAQSVSAKLPDEQIIEIDAQGNVSLNGMTFDDPAYREMPRLTTTLVRFRQASESAQNPAMVTIQPSPDTMHQRVIDVLNACAAAGVNNVSFGG
jgi:biopolymer transport protein ExbD